MCDRDRFQIHEPEELYEIEHPHSRQSTWLTDARFKALFCKDCYAEFQENLRFVTDALSPPFFMCESCIETFETECESDERY